MENTIVFLRTYLSSIGYVEGEYKIEHQMDGMGMLFTLSVPREHKSNGILMGKDRKNINVLKDILRIVGAIEKISPHLKIVFLT